MADDGWEDVTDPAEIKKVFGQKAAGEFAGGGGIGGGAAVPLSADAMRSIRLDALDKIALARKLKQQSRDKLLATGFGSGLAASIGGTPAADVRGGVGTLKSAGALANILKMAQANGGKNPLTPMSNSDVELIANMAGNLDPSQSDEQFQGNVGLYEDAYTRAFQGASDNHQNLEEGLKWREATLAGKPYKAPPMASRRPATKPAQQPRVIDFNDLPE